MGVDLSLNILNRRDYRTPADTSESMIFLRKSTHVHSPNGGESKPQVGQRPRLPDLMLALRIIAFPEEIHTFSPLLVGVDLSLKTGCVLDCQPT